VNAISLREHAKAWQGGIFPACAVSRCKLHGTNKHGNSSGATQVPNVSLVQY